MPKCYILSIDLEEATLIVKLRLLFASKRVKYTIGSWDSKMFLLYTNKLSAALVSRYQQLIGFEQA